MGEAGGWKEVAHGHGGVAAGAGGGAAIGSVIAPGIGTVAGAAVGAFGGHQRDMKKKYGKEGQY